MINKKCSSSAIENEINELGRLMLEMRFAFSRGENVMEFARIATGHTVNQIDSTMIAYDLQVGSYIAAARENPESRTLWCSQLAKILSPLVNESSFILEVGSGEATTLAGVIKYLESTPKQVLGFDVSWSRCTHGLKWLAESHTTANLFVADLFDIPLEDSSIDVVYTSHSLEPNGGREEAAIKELLRVARSAVVVVEPIYELADAEAQARMRKHHYIRNLKITAESIGAIVKDYRLLDYSVNPLNPSGLLLIEKPFNDSFSCRDVRWRCPLTHSSLVENELGFFSPKTGTVYPVLAGIPLLRSNHAVVATSFESIIHG